MRANQLSLPNGAVGGAAFNPSRAFSSNSALSPIPAGRASRAGSHSGTRERKPIDPAVAVPSSSAASAPSMRSRRNSRPESRHHSRNSSGASSHHKPRRYKEGSIRGSSFRALSRSRRHSPLLRSNKAIRAFRRSFSGESSFFCSLTASSSNDSSKTPCPLSPGVPEPTDRAALQGTPPLSCDAAGIPFAKDRGTTRCLCALFFQGALDPSSSGFAQAAPEFFRTAHGMPSSDQNPTAASG